VEKKDVDAFLASYEAPIRSLALRLRKLVREVEPTALEQIDKPAKLLAYGYSATYGGTICVIMPYPGWVNLGFPRGVDLPDPTGLLTGTGKRARHVKVRQARDVDAPALRALLKAAVKATPR
jgi:hypothetical protein